MDKSDKTYTVRVDPADGFWVVRFVHGAYTRERDFLELPDVLLRRMAVLDMVAPAESSSVMIEVPDIGKRMPRPNASPGRSQSWPYVLYVPESELLTDPLTADLMIIVRERMRIASELDIRDDFRDAASSARFLSRD